MKYVITLLLSLFCLSSFAGDKEITIASDPWCPFSCSKNDAREGLGVELVRAAFEPLGYKVNYINMTWIRSLQELKAGKVDMVCAVDSTVDATTFIAGSQSIFDTNFAIFSRADSNFIYDEKDINSLKGLVIGVNGAHSLKGLLNGAIGEYFDKNENNKDIIKKVFGEKEHT